MSGTLVYEIENTPYDRTLSDELRYATARKLWDTDGSVSHGTYVFTSKDIPYLEGLRDAKVEDAEKLLRLVRKHKFVRVWIEQ